MGKPEGSKSGSDIAEANASFDFGFDARALRLLPHCDKAAGNRACEVHVWIGAKNAVY